MRELARNWLDYAKHDLQAAQQLLSNQELTGLAAFHCQQCIEKSFKALLELNDRPVPRIHDLVTLHQQVADIEPFPVNESILRQVEDAYIDTRYPKSEMPADSQLPSLSKTSSFVTLARSIHDLASLKLRQKSHDGQT